jgi:hypothetical protein
VHGLLAHCRGSNFGPCCLAWPELGCPFPFAACELVVHSGCDKGLCRLCWPASTDGRCCLVSLFLGVVSLIWGAPGSRSCPSPSVGAGAVQRKGGSGSSEPPRQASRVERGMAGVPNPGTPRWVVSGWRRGLAGAPLFALRVGQLWRAASAWLARAVACVRFVYGLALAKTCLNLCCPSLMGLCVLESKRAPVCVARCCLFAGGPTAREAGLQASSAVVGHGAETASKQGAQGPPERGGEHRPDLHAKTSFRMARPSQGPGLKNGRASFAEVVGDNGLTGGLILRGTGVDGRLLVDDGLSTVAASQSALEAWREEENETPDGPPWPANVVMMLSSGLVVDGPQTCLEQLAVHAFVGLGAREPRASSKGRALPSLFSCRKCSRHVVSWQVWRCLRHAQRASTKKTLTWISKRHGTRGGTTKSHIVAKRPPSPPGQFLTMHLVLRTCCKTRSCH